MHCMQDSKESEIRVPRQRCIDNIDDNVLSPGLALKEEMILKVTANV